MTKEQQTFELILFGGLGDLATRKLLPALYMLFAAKRLQGGSIYLLTRQNISQPQLLEHVQGLIAKYVSPQYQDEQAWQEFAKVLQVATLDATSVTDFQNLAEMLKADTTNRIFYLATGSDLYADICQGLHQAKLIHATSKVVLEKPIGKDLATATAINQLVAQYFSEQQIYRIDHYLGKETVQNLLVLRFANSIFEHQWSQKYIDNIQITISETLGIENRAGFYESVGAMRDMLQNHLLQLLCITAMEPPASMCPDAVRDEKVKVLKALKPLTRSDVADKIVFGQYDHYREERGVSNNSSTETFVAAKVEIDNWRWAGVPFYLRTGKCLAERLCEIVVSFKEIPHSIFPLQHKNSMANKLIFRLQPDDGIRMQLCEKRVGPGMNVRPVNLSLNPSHVSESRVPEAYERLLYDVIQGNQTLFLREDELLSAWQWVDPILEYWQAEELRPKRYASGSWGPAAATLLLAKDGRLWTENN